MKEAIEQLRREQQENSKDIALLKQTSENTLKAIHHQAKAQTDLISELSGLTSAINEDRIRREEHDEKRELQDKYIQEQISSNTKRHDYFVEHYKQPIERLIVSQGRWKKFIDAIFSRAGTIVLVAVIVALLYMFGFDPKAMKL